ncbi:globin-coupled sensor protein, partial [Mesorhizobium sp. M00.F.Ca.ET.186.01.1.1]
MSTCPFSSLFGLKGKAKKESFFQNHKEQGKVKLQGQNTLSRQLALIHLTEEDLSI